MIGEHRRVVADAMTWVESAHNATGRQGISAGYDLTSGWLPTYPETSGYLVPTMLRAAEVLGRPGLAARAEQVGKWLLGLQLPSGAFPGGTGTDGDPVVFDVGQIMLGLTALYRRTGDAPTLAALRRAAAWLEGVQRPDGAWLSHFDYPNTYSSRVTWAVADLWTITGEPGARSVVERSLAYLLDQVRPNGWIEGMRFSEDRTAWTHTIGYALRGLLRCGDLVGGDLGERCVVAARDCATRLAAVRTDLYPLLPGEIGPDFEPLADYACLTGDAQLVTIWLDLAHRDGDRSLHARGVEVLARLAELQVRQPLEPATVGALPGSWPLTGAFEPLAFPNWSTKFLADAALNVAARHA